MSDKQKWPCPVCNDTVETDKARLLPHKDGIGKLCAKGTGFPIAALRNLIEDATA